MKLLFEFAEMVTPPSPELSPYQRNAHVRAAQFQLLPADLVRDAKDLFRRLISVNGVPIPEAGWAPYKEPVASAQAGEDAMHQPLHVGDYVSYTPTKSSRAYILQVSSLTPRQFRYQNVLTQSNVWHESELKYQKSAMKLDVEEEYRFPDDVVILPKRDK